MSLPEKCRSVGRQTTRLSEGEGGGGTGGGKSLIFFFMRLSLGFSYLVRWMIHNHDNSPGDVWGMTRMSPQMLLSHSTRVPCKEMVIERSSPPKKMMCKSISESELHGGVSKQPLWLLRVCRGRKTIWCAWGKGETITILARMTSLDKISRGRSRRSRWRNDVVCCSWPHERFHNIREDMVKPR